MRKAIAKGVAVTAISTMLGLAGPAFAQDSDESREDIIVTAQQAQKQVVSNGDLGALGAKSALDTPFNVTSYTAQLVLDQQSETIGDVLENEPSVRTTYGSGNQSELFVIRGFALFGDDVSIDGLYGVTPRQIVSPELYESIQVLNGASAFLFGAAPGGSGIGGGINLTPKRAQKTLLRATASYSADSIFGGNFDIGTRFGGEKEFGIRVNGVYRSGDTAVDNEHREARVIGASFDFRKGPGRFFLDFGYEDQRAEWSRPTVRLAANIGVPEAPKSTDNYGQPWTFTKLRDVYAIARAEVDITDDIMAYMAAGMRDGAESGNYSTVTITNIAAAAIPATPTTPAVPAVIVAGAGTASRLFVPRSDNNESGQLGVRGKFATGPVSHEFSLGGSVNFTENRNSFTFGAFPTSVRTPCGAPSTGFCTNLYNAPIVAVPTNATLPSAGGSLTDLPRVSTSEFKSLFISDTLGVMDGKLQLTVGARRQNLIVNGYNRGTLLRTSHYNKSATTPVVGLIVRPTENLSFYANRIEGLAQGPAAPTTAINAGEIFPPFRSVQYEIGGKIAIRGLTGTLALYQTKQPSQINRDVPGGVLFTVDGEQRNRGIELTFNGEPSKFIRFIGGIAINDAKLLRTSTPANNGNRAIGVPKYQVNFGAEIVPPFLPKATVTARVVHTSTQEIDIANTQTLPAWTRFDLGLRYVLVADDHPITLRLSAENIDNRNYWYSAFGGYLLQGQPRTVKASVTFEY